MFKLFLLFALAFAEDKVCNALCKETKCNSEGKCSECIDGDYILEDGVCYHKFEKNCQELNENKKCQWCLDTYKVDPTGKCVVGEETCSQHYEEKDDGTMACPDCKEGEEIVDGKCGKCTAIDYCEVYTKDGEGCKCKTCEGGAQLKEGKCEVRDKYCATNVDNDDSKCQTCKSGYYLDTDKKCKKGNIKECITYNNNNADECKYCTEQNTNNKCVECTIGGCDKCKDGTELKCETCETGYFKSADEKECTQCHESCAKCTGPEEGKCLECAENYVSVDTEEEEVDPSDEPEESAKRAGEQVKKCYEKIEGCTEYKVVKGVLKCKTCAQTLFKSEDEKSCLKCHESCATCSEAGKDDKCKTCTEGYYDPEPTKEGKCEQCHSSCKACSEPGETKCTKCNEGSTLAGNTVGKCHPNIEGCKTHILVSDKLKCTECESGYYFNKDGVCTKSPAFDNSFCYQYKVDGKCGTCKKGDDEVSIQENEECSYEYKAYCYDATVTGDECLMCAIKENTEGCKAPYCNEYALPKDGQCGNGSFGVFIAFFIAIIMVLF